MSLHNSVSQSIEISNEESKWQYVGNGLRENGDRQSSQKLAKCQTVTTLSLHKKKEASRNFEFSHPFEEFGSGSDEIK